jgi:hypothetical protein
LLLTKFHRLFDVLPICTVIQDKVGSRACVVFAAASSGRHQVFVVHGGLSRLMEAKLSDYDAIERRKEPPIRSLSVSDHLFQCALWSTPQSMSCDSARPASCYPSVCLEAGSLTKLTLGDQFDKSLTHYFLRKNGLCLMVRSHDVTSSGFEVLHDTRLITLFSASRFNGKCTNKGRVPPQLLELAAISSAWAGHHQDRT